MIWLLGFILLSFVVFPTVDGRQFYEAMAGLMVLSVVFSIKLYRKIHWSVGLAFAVVAISALWEFFIPSTYPVITAQYELARGGGEILYAFVTLLLFASLLLFKEGDFFNQVMRLLFMCAVIDSIMIIGKFLIFKENFAMLSNNAADASFIACMLPMVLIPEFLEPVWPTIGSLTLMILAILITRSSTGYAAIGVAAAFCLLQAWSFKKWFLAMVPITLAFSFLGYWYLGQELLATSGRTHVFLGSWQFFKQNANWLTGFGTGTFTIWGDAWQRAEHVNQASGFDLWIWAHNEPLQILFENGILGLVTSLIVYGFLLVKTWRKESLAFPMACVYFFTGLTEMPLRLFVTQLLGVALLARAFKEEEWPIAKRDGI